MAMWIEYKSIHTRCVWFTLLHIEYFVWCSALCHLVDTIHKYIFYTLKHFAAELCVHVLRYDCSIEFNKLEQFFHFMVSDLVRNIVFGVIFPQF